MVRKRIRVPFPPFFYPYDHPTTMNEDFDYSHAPKAFIHCYHSQCRQAGHCLRRLAALHVPADVVCVSALSPNALPADGTGCPHFLSAEKVRIAWGIYGMFDNLPLKAARAIRKTLILHFSKTRFYRLQRKESYLTPAEQDYIRRVFRRYGVAEEPVYEFYTEEYQWR